MKDRTGIILAIIAAACIIGVCLVWRGCGTEASVKCPNGASATLHSRGSFESGAVEELCKELEAGRSE